MAENLLATKHRKERLILAVDYAVRQALDEINQERRLSEPKWTSSPEFTLVLCETISKFGSGALQSDLVAFAAHAKRRTVTAEDVQLAARKSSALSKRVSSFITENTKRTRSSRGQKKKKIGTDGDDNDFDEDRDNSRMSRPSIFDNNEEDESETGDGRRSDRTLDDFPNGDEEEEDQLFAD